MFNITHSRPVLPHLLDTRFFAVRLYRLNKNVEFVCRKYHISKASLMRWNKQFNGTRDSLLDKSHRPKSPHPNAHTPEEIEWIKNYHRRNPNISPGEMFGKLREDKSYSRHPGSLYRIFVKLGFRKKKESTKKKSRHLGQYDTPERLGIKWQMDVKYVPNACYSGIIDQKFYQYTVIEEASRKRFIYPYMEQSSFSTIDFIKRAITFFGYAPLTIQTDNGGEFTYSQPSKRIHPVTVFCNKNGITHKLIRPRTPWHNGKVERSHRNDQERFYNVMSFYSYEDLRQQMRRYMDRSNNIPSAVLGWKSPNEKHRILMALEAGT